MLSIRCPLCEEMAFLTMADWEDFIGQLDMGQVTRIGLVCLECHKEFILEVSLGQVIRG